MTDLVRERPKRVDRRNVLTAEQRPGFVRRFVNDVDDSIERAIDFGYTSVLDKNADTTANRVGRPSKLGNVVRKSVRGGMYAVLMEIPEKWYDENQAEKAAIRAEKTKMMEPAGEGQYGSVSINK